MRREKDRARRSTKNLQEEKKRSSETEDHEKQCLATLKRFERRDENELERKLRLEKVVASKQLRLTVETEEETRARLENDAERRARLENDAERRARLENDAAIKRLRLAMQTGEERKARLENESILYILYLCIQIIVLIFVYDKG